jgi:hypothetical protein
VLLVLLVATAACKSGERPTGGPGGAPAPGAAAPTEAPAAGICGLFSPQELAEVLGEPMKPGTVSGPLGSACTWDSEREGKDVMIQIVDADSYEDGSRASGGEALTGIGERAFAGPWLGGARAGALTATHAVYVLVSGTSDDRARAVALLPRVIERLPPPR